MTDDFFVLRRYKHLNNLLPIKCICGAPMTLAKEFSNAITAGVETHPCQACGAPPATVYCHTVKADNDKAAGMLRKLLGSLKP